MITFYAGNTLSGITDRILQTLAAQHGGNHIVLVPDRNTLGREETVLRALGGSMVNVEVLPFARFASRILGRGADNCLTPEACTVLLSKALLSCRDSLTYYRGAVDTDGFANEMYSSLVAVRNSGVTVQDLLAAADRMQGKTADKTRDLAIIYQAYLQVLGTMLDPTSRLERLARAIPDSAVVSGTCFYVIDFFAFNPMQYRVLEGLMGHAKELHIGYIASTVGRDNRRIFPHALRDNLLAMAQRVGAFTQTVAVHTPLEPYKVVMQDHLFGMGAVPAIERSVRDEAAAAIRIFVQSDTAEQLRTVCAEICDLLRQGYRYRDMALVCPDPEMYWDVLHNVFHEYDIPMFADRKAVLSDEPVVRLLLDLMQCVKQNHDFDVVMRVVKNPLFGMPQAKVDAFENYCRRYGIKYTLFLHSFTVGDEDEIALAEEVRAYYVSLLPDLAECTQVSHFIEVLRDLMVTLDVDKRFKEFYDRQLKMGYPRSADVSLQVPSRLRELMAMFVRLTGDTPCDVTLFLRLFLSALQSVKIALLPQSADCVYIGDAIDSRYDNVKVMFVIGAEEGNLPMNPADGSILSEVYHDRLAAKNIQLKPTNKEQWLAARFYLQQILLTPTHRLYVGYALRGADDEPQTPSGVVSTLCELFGLTVTKGLGHSVAQQIGTADNAYRVLLRLNKQLDESVRETIRSHLSDDSSARYEHLRSDTVGDLPDAAKLFFRSEQTSVSQLEQYFRCPYAHFVRYGLRATERKDADAGKDEVGEMLHRVMETFFKTYTAQLDDMDDAAIEQAVRACVDEAYSRSRFAHDTETPVFERLLRESRIVLRPEVAKVRRSHFKPVQCEAVFGKGGDYPPIELGPILLRGKIDRIDRCGDLVSVIDYKSGATHYELKYVYYGIKVQLYAYLYALQCNGLTPVGGFYKPLSGAFRKADDDLPMGCLVGQFPLDKPEWLNLYDPDLPISGTSDMIPIRASAKGGYVALHSKHMGMNYDVINNMIDFVRELMKGAISEIGEGYIAPSPIDDACKYCPAYAMCPKGRNTEARGMRSPDQGSFVLQEETL